MTEVSEFQPGLPTWVDLSTPDPDESAKFYGELLGWEAEEVGDEEQYGGYRMFVKEGNQVGGLMKTQEEWQPPSWNVYIAVSDVEETAEKVKDADGDVIVEPMDVGDQGRMAFFADPTGAAFGVWQANENTGMDVVSQPGAPAWHQVNTREPDKAEEFYKAVFGWESEQIDTGGTDYWQYTADGKNAAGMFRMGDDFPDDVPAHWIVYFAVDDLDQYAEKAKEGGASVRAEPIDNEAGRMAVFTDPHGAAFALINQGAGSVAGEGEGEDEGDEDGDAEGESGGGEQDDAEGKSDDDADGDQDDADDKSDES
jgi:predicted enzyme related to lactoylglutathione lyase